MEGVRRGGCGKRLRKEWERGNDVITFQLKLKK